MALKDINSLKQAFENNKEPDQTDFGDVFDSYHHKSLKLSQTDILGLNNALDGKASKEDLKQATTNFKGYHTDEDALKNAYPQSENKKDFFAWVGSKPTLIWKVDVDGGAWINTGDEPTEQEIDLAEYAKAKNDVNERVVYAPNGVIDLDPYIKTDDLSNRYSDSEETAPTSSLLKKLHYDLYGSILEEIVPFADDGNTWTQDMGANGGHWYYVNQDVLRNNLISKIKARFNKQGTFSILIGKNVATENYIYEIYKTFDVVEGINELPVNIALNDNEWLGFCAPNDTAQFRYNTQRVENPIGGAFRSGKSTNTGKGDLCIGIFIGEINSQNSEETIPFTNKTNSKSTTPSQWYYVNHAVLNGKFISKIKINNPTAGKLSVLFGKKVGTSDYTFTKKVFDVNIGINEIDINRQLDNDETLGFFDYDDTATFYYGASGSSNPIGGNFVQRNGVTGEWKSPTPSLDLSIGVFTTDTSIKVKGDVNKLNVRIDVVEETMQSIGLEPTGLLRGKSFSVLGDSISTFRGIIPSGHSTWYPTGDVLDYAQTWWGQLTTAKYGMRLIANASWSGGTLTSGTGGQAIPDFINKLGDSPNYIFLFMGTNDYTRKVEIGDLAFYSFDRKKFTQAACDLVNRTMITYPHSTIVLMSMLQRNPLTATNGKNPNKIADSDVNFLFDYNDAYRRVAQVYGVQFVDMFQCGINFYNLNTYLIDGLHPNAKGMDIIANYIYRNLAMYVKR